MTTEKFTAYMWAIVDCESSGSFDEAIVVIVPGPRERAVDELARRQALSIEDDDHADMYHAVLPLFVDAIAWNSHDPAPEDWAEKAKEASR